MSELYQSIPTGRREEYLQHATATFDEAVEPVIHEMAWNNLVAASDLTRHDAAAHLSDDEAAKFLAKHDLRDNFRKEIDAFSTNSIGDEAERYVNVMPDTRSAADLQREAYKYHFAKAPTPEASEELKVQNDQDPKLPDIPPHEAEQ